MAHALSPDDVLKVARLSRLTVRQDQVEDLRARLSAVLGYMERLRALDLAGIEPMAHVGGTVNRMDADEPGPTLSTEALMRLAPDPMPPFVRVPKVLEEGGRA